MSSASAPWAVWSARAGRAASGCPTHLCDMPGVRIPDVIMGIRQGLRRSLRRPGGPGGAAPYMTPRRIFQAPAPKKCAETYRGLNPGGRGPGGLIGFVFRVCLSFQKIKNLVLFLVILFGSGYSGFRDNLLFYPRPGLFLGRLPAKKFFKNFFCLWVEKRAIF